MMLEKKTTGEISEWFINIRECNNDIIQSNPINLKEIDKVWVSRESVIKELELFERDVKHHFDKVTNPKLNVIRAINTIINKLLNDEKLKVLKNNVRKRNK